MTAYLRCTVTGDGVGPCYLDDHDAVEAAASSEFLQVETRMAGGNPWFPRQHGLRRGVVVDGQWSSYVALKLDRLEREFLAAVRPGLG